jgi:senataxin
MHPEISSFPNSYFYSNKILDAPNVDRSYGKQYLPGPMFGPYSFINVAGGREEYEGDGRSYKNMSEVAVVVTILKKLHKGLSYYACSFCM